MLKVGKCLEDIYQLYSLLCLCEVQGRYKFDTVYHSAVVAALVARDITGNSIMACIIIES